MYGIINKRRGVEKLKFVVLYTQITTPAPKVMEITIDKIPQVLVSFFCGCCGAGLSVL